MCLLLCQDAHELLSQVIDQIKEDTIAENKSFRKRQALESDSGCAADGRPDMENLEVCQCRSCPR